MGGSAQLDPKSTFLCFNVSVFLGDTWTTFMKARLNCSRPGEVPFYYNELQSTFFLPELDLIYGIFTTNV